MRTLWADFNEVFDDEYLWTSLRVSPPLVPSPEVGEWFVLYDSDGASCQGILRSIEGPIVTFKMDWSQWRDDPVPMQMPSATAEQEPTRPIVTHKDEDEFVA